MRLYKEWLRKEMLRMGKEMAKEDKEDTSGPNAMQNNTMRDNTEKYECFAECLDSDENFALVLFTLGIMVVPPLVSLLVGLYLGVCISMPVIYLMSNIITWFAAMVVKPNEEMFHIDSMSVIFMALIFAFEMISSVKFCIFM